MTFNISSYFRFYLKNLFDKYSLALSLDSHPYSGHREESVLADSSWKEKEIIASLLCDGPFPGIIALNPHKDPQR